MEYTEEGNVNEEVFENEDGQEPVVEDKPKRESFEDKAEKIANDSEPRNLWSKKNIDKKSGSENEKKKPLEGRTITKDDIDSKKLAERKPEDIKDSAGNILAKAGAERRVFEENQKLKKDFETFNKEVLPKIKKDYDEAIAVATNLKSLDGLVKANNLTHQELNVIAEIAVEFKKSPVDALKRMLTNAINQGYDVSEIINAGQAQNIESILSKKLEPLQKLFEERKLQEKIENENAEMMQQVQDFQDTFPHSKLHSKEIVEVTNKLGLEPNIENFTKAYWKLRNFYESKGYDFSKNWSEATVSSVVKPRPKVEDMPTNGRNTMNNNSRDVYSNIGVNASYGDIISDVFRELNNK